MADISKVKLPNGTTYNVKDSRYPDLTGSESTYLRGDGQFAVPSVSVMTTTAQIIDGGNCLVIKLATS